MRIINFSKDKNGYTMISLGKELSEIYPNFDKEFKNFQTINQLLQIKDENFLLFQDIIKLYKTLYSTRNIDEISYMQMKKYIKSYLGNTQSFLTSLQKFINKDKFKIITNTIHFYHIEYQFCYELRNISQHNKLNISIAETNNKQIKILVNKNELLDDFNITKEKIKKLFDLYPETIDLIPQLNSFFNCQCEIANWVILENYNAKQHKNLLTFAKTYSNENSLYLGNQNDISSKINEPRKMNMSLTKIEIEKINRNIEICEKCPQQNFSLGHIFNYFNYFS